VSPEEGNNLNVPFSTALCLAVGLVYSMAGRSAFSKEEMLGRWLVALVVFQTLIFTPIFLYAVIFYPDWSVLYLFRPLQWLEPFGLEWVFGLACLALAYAASIAGYILGRHQVLVGKPDSPPVLVFVLCFLTIVSGIVLNNRLIHAGTLPEYRAGAAKLVFTRVLGSASLAYVISVPLGIYGWKKLFSRKPSHM
jgi:hypothetical protein